jgi:pfkB family carbohydrate kinase
MPTNRTSLTTRFDYTAVGHVTVDVMSDGTCRPGGSAFYCGVQAARLGQRTLIVTRGVARQIEELVAPYRGEFELQILPARCTTTLLTLSGEDARRQWVQAWAGPIDNVEVDTTILHLAPVARETPGGWRGHADFLALTPQGLVREWTSPDGEIRLSRAVPEDRLPERCDALVTSEAERGACGGAIARTTESGGLVAITAGAGATTLLTPDRAVVEVQSIEVGDTGDDLGAGDVFAAAFFLALVEGRAPVSAAAFASAAAAVRLGGVGAQAIGDRAAIEAKVRAGQI